MMRPPLVLALIGHLVTPVDGHAQEPGPLAEVAEAVSAAEQETEEAAVEENGRESEEPLPPVEEAVGSADEVAPPEYPTPVVPEPRPSARALYDRARAALEQHDRDRARTLLRELRRHYTAALETAALAQLLGQAEPDEERRLQWSRQDTTQWVPRSHRYLRTTAEGRPERYSRRTGERLSIRGWEQVDFVITAMTYGACVGAAYTEGATGDLGVAPMMLGAVAYGALSTTLLAAGDPERGDLPLALGITAYVPLTVLLGGIAADVRDEEDMLLAVAIGGTAALPLAAVAAAFTDLDPGDVQLTRDAGFWGMVFAMAGTAGVGCSRGYGCDDSTFGLAGLGGLYLGLGAGVLLAMHTEVSLERVRTTTLFGYGSAFLGGIIGGYNFGDEAAWGGVALGGGVGLIIGALATLSLDRLPGDAIMVSDASSRAPSLVMMPVVDRTGAVAPGIGVDLSGVLGGR